MPASSVQTAPPIVARPSAPLVLRDVAWSWDSNPVLQLASLTLEPGVVAWLGGANGSGKTTLMRIAAGLLAPERGRVSLAGLDHRRDYQRRLGFLPAGDRGLYPHLSIRDRR